VERPAEVYSPDVSSGRAQRGVLAVAAVAAGIAACGSHAPAAPRCLVNEDCPADQYCEGETTPGANWCVIAPGGVCRPIDFSIFGRSCTEDKDCGLSIAYCGAATHECSLNICRSFGDGPYICEQGMCSDSPDAGPVVQCAPGCRAGTRYAICRTCFCESCPATDADGGADVP